MIECSNALKRFEKKEVGSIDKEARSQERRNIHKTADHLRKCIQAKPDLPQIQTIRKIEQQAKKSTDATIKVENTQSIKGDIAVVRDHGRNLTASLAIQIKREEIENDHSSEIKNDKAHEEIETAEEKKNYIKGRIIVENTVRGSGNKYCEVIRRDEGKIKRPIGINGLNEFQEKVARPELILVDWQGETLAHCRWTSPAQETIVDKEGKGLCQIKRKFDIFIEQRTFLRIHKLLGQTSLEGRAFDQASRYIQENCGEKAHSCSKLQGENMDGFKERIGKLKERIERMEEWMEDYDRKMVKTI